MTVMYFLGSCENYILFIFVLLINTSFIGCLGELKSGYKKCFFIDNKTIYSTSKVNNEAAERLTKGGKPTLADEIPEAPKDLKLKANGRYPTIRWWTNPRVTYGLEHVRHILLKVVQEYTTENGTFQKTEYTLLNATGKDFSASDTIYSYNCTKFNTGAYRMEATLWFLGNLKHSADGRLIAHITEKSKSETAKLEKEDIIPERKKEADECICSSRITIDIRALQPEGQLSTEIQGSGLPNDTNIEIQVIKDSTSGKYIKEITYVSSRQIQNPYGHKFNVTRGNNYYIRVLRHCQKGYYVSCQKDEADAMRSESVFMKSGSSHLQPSSSKDEHSRVVTRHTETMQQVLQIATVTFAFGTCILAEVALIFKLMTVLICHEKKSTRSCKRSTYVMRSAYVRLNNKGHPMTHLIRRKRIAIVFTKDSREHVYNIHHELRNREIETIPFDEISTPEMRANWIQAAENVVTEFEAIMFVISPLLYNICRKEETELPDLKEETINANTETLNKFPAVVLDALKNVNAWAGTGKTKIISVCIAETEHDCKQLSMKMRREHPVIFNDKIFFYSLTHKHETKRMKGFQKLVNKIISSL